MSRAELAVIIEYYRGVSQTAFTRVTLTSILSVTSVYPAFVPFGHDGKISARAAEAIHFLEGMTYISHLPFDTDNRLKAKLSQYCLYSTNTWLHTIKSTESYTCTGTHRHTRTEKRSACRAPLQSAASKSLGTWQPPPPTPPAMQQQ